MAGEAPRAGDSVLCPCGGWCAGDADLCALFVAEDAARAQRRADEARFVEHARSVADEVAARFSELLPDGMRIVFGGDLLEPVDAHYEPSDAARSAVDRAYLGRLLHPSGGGVRRN